MGCRDKCPRQARPEAWRPRYKSGSRRHAWNRRCSRPSGSPSNAIDIHLPNMCIGNPLSYPCSHTTVFWQYCPSARRDVESDDEVVCDNVSFLYGEETDAPCPMRICRWEKKRGCWTCCSCKQGPNYMAWCTMAVKRPSSPGKGSGTQYGLTTCDHGCCDRCVKVERGTSKRPVGLCSLELTMLGNRGTKLLFEPDRKRLRTNLFA